MDIVTFVLLLMFVIGVCAFIFMKACNELDYILMLYPHSKYKTIADEVLKTQITFGIIGVCIGCVLMYVLIGKELIII